MLLVAGLATMAFGHRVDASVIFAVVLVNAIIGWNQEGKAESALDAIRNMLAPVARVFQALLLRNVDRQWLHLSEEDRRI